MSSWSSRSSKWWQILRRLLIAFSRTDSISSLNISTRKSCDCLANWAEWVASSHSESTAAFLTSASHQHHYYTTTRLFQPVQALPVICLNTSQANWYSIYPPRKNERLSWPWWLVIYWDGLGHLSADSHPFKPLDSDPTGSRTHDRLTVRPMPYG